MRDLAVMLALMIANLALPYAVTRWDRRRLGSTALARAWNGPSWAAAVTFFGPFCLPAHFWVTRRTVKGLLTGVACTGAIVALELTFAWALTGAR